LIITIYAPADNRGDNGIYQTWGIKKAFIKSKRKA